MLDLHIHVHKLDDKILKEIINQNQITIIANLQELQDKVAELQASVDAEQAQIEQLVNGQTQTIAALEAQIAELQALVDAAPTPEQLQAVVDNLQSIKSDVESTVPDAQTGNGEEASA